MELIEVRLKNWEKYNYRNDIDNPSWFRLQHSIFENPDLFSMSAIEIAAYVYILCCASKKSSPRVVLNTDHAKLVGRITPQALKSALKKLFSADVLEFQPLPVDVTSTLRQNPSACSTDSTNRQTNKHILRENDFEEVWDLYDYKKDRNGAEDAFFAIIKTREDFEALKKAIPNYADDCVRHKRDKRYFSRLLKDKYGEHWREWVNPEGDSSGQIKVKFTENGREAST